MTFVFSNRNTRCDNVNGSLCSGSPTTGTICRVTSSVERGASGRYFRNAVRRLSGAMGARPYVFATSLTTTETLIRGNVAPSYMTNFSLNRVSTLTFSKVLSSRRTFELIYGENRLVSGTTARGPNTVTTILGLAPRGIRRVYSGFSGACPMGCGSPTRAIITAADRGTSTFYRTIGTRNKETGLLTMDNTFRSPFVTSTTRKLKGCVRGISFTRPGIRVCSSCATRPCSNSFGALMGTRIRGPMG